jgi:kynurenine formamidase
MMSDRIDEVVSMVRSLRAVDLAPTLERGIPKWITHPATVIDPTIQHERDGYYCQTLSISEHTGCHVDAPAHVHASMMSATIDTFPVDTLVAKGVVYDFSDRNWAPGELLTSEDFLRSEDIHGDRVEQGEIALLNFGWMQKHWATDRRARWYAANAPGMNEDLVRLLADRKVRAVGVDTIACDTPLVDGTAGPAPGHETYWLPNNILIIECLANLHLLSRTCLFVAAPLPIRAGSGSPLRPIAYCT